jgi:hypothetical protein
MDGKFGTIEEKVSQTPMIVSYYPVGALENTWAVLWMQPMSDGLIDNATMTTSDRNSTSLIAQQW